MLVWSFGALWFMGVGVVFIPRIGEDCISHEDIIVHLLLSSFPRLPLTSNMPCFHCHPSHHLPFIPVAANSYVSALLITSSLLHAAPVLRRAI